MKKTNRSRNVLALESAVAGGSVALIREEKKFVLNREGPECSRAENLLSIIAGILKEAELTLRDINLIAVSTGPGSYSGIRIGLSTAMGLGDALGVRCVGVSVLDAMAWAARLEGSFIVAVPVGKNDVAWQIFRTGGQGAPQGDSDPELLSSASFIDRLKGLPEVSLFGQRDLLDRIGDQIPLTTPRVDAGRGIAEMVGREAMRQGETDSPLRPIYLRNRDSDVRSARF
ncbi:MAG TPA: tRNA (adenosine(37)-N6)-threonylcarbamoyltransferase complex dimerization subunit type 1 TsaB [Pyrinomonadaceae bacterium]|nr:tRNA (adenosine(37)-N6)-threonylcarbamoyltransferase complex dimerization subunit type 1 TsaB [Pyrinomonadaceae bacterium]